MNETIVPCAGCNTLGDFKDTSAWSDPRVDTTF